MEKIWNVYITSLSCEYVFRALLYLKQLMEKDFEFVLIECLSQIKYSRYIGW
jgi:hypothetical protein